MPESQTPTVALGVMVVGPQLLGIVLMLTVGGAVTVIFSSLDTEPQLAAMVSLMV